MEHTTCMLYHKYKKTDGDLTKKLNIFWIITNSNKTKVKQKYHLIMSNIESFSIIKVKKLRGKYLFLCI